MALVAKENAVGTVGALAQAGMALYNAWLMIKFIRSEIESLLSEQGEWEGVDDDGQGDAFISKFGSLFDSFSASAVWFGLFQVIVKFLLKS